MALLNIPSLFIPNLKRNPTQADFTTWAQGMSQTIQAMQTNLESAIEAFIGSTAQMGTDVIVADSIVAGTIIASHISSTGAVITLTIQVQDAIITNAKVVDIETQKIYVTSNSAQTLTTAGSTLILPGLLQISGGGGAQQSIKVKGTAAGTLDTSARSLLINGVEQYTSTSNVATGFALARLDTSGTLIVGSLKTFNTNASTAAQDDLATEINAAAVTDLVVLSSYGVIGTGAMATGGNLRPALQGMGIDVNSLEGIMATGGNASLAGRIPLVCLGKRGIGNGAGVTVFTNGSTNAGPAQYQDFLTGNDPAHGSAPQTSDVTIIEGGTIRAATILASSLNVTQLSAISANMGTLTAGTINGGKIISGATSAAYTEMGPSGVTTYDAAGNAVARLSSASNQIDFSTGSLRFQAGADINMQSVNTDPAEIHFNNTSDTLQAKVTASSTGLIKIVPGSNGGADLELGHYDGSIPGNMREWSNIYIAATTNLYIYPDIQHVGTLNTQNTLPRTDKTYDLGSSSFRWLTLYVATGGININTAGTSTAVISAGALSVPTACTQTLTVYINGTPRQIPCF